VALVLDFSSLFWKVEVQLVKVPILEAKAELQEEQRCAQQAEEENMRLRNEVRSAVYSLNRD